MSNLWVMWRSSRKCVQGEKHLPKSISLVPAAMPGCDQAPRWAKCLSFPVSHTSSPSYFCVYIMSKPMGTGMGPIASLAFLINEIDMENF